MEERCKFYRTAAEEFEISLQSDINHCKHPCGMKGIKIWTNIKMQTGIKYIPALGSFMIMVF